jgi:hypothetical protein
MKCLLIVWFYGCLFFVTSSWGAAREQQIAPDGKTQISSDVDHVHIQITLTTREVDIGKSTDPRPPSPTSSCTYTRYPCSLVDNIEISVGGESLFVPRSVFSDLADLNMASIENHGKNFVLTLRGGDASESYIATITLDRSQIKRRVFASAMLPQKPLQQTVYYTSVLGD